MSQVHYFQTRDSLLGVTGGILYRSLLRPEYFSDCFEADFSLPLDAPCEISFGGARRAFFSHCDIEVFIINRDGD